MNGTKKYKSVLLLLSNKFGVDIISEKTLTTLVIPDNAVIEKEAIFTTSSVIIGHHAAISRELRVGFLVAGESVSMEEYVKSEGGIRTDMWCKFEKNVDCGGDAYLSEFTVVNGKIDVEGDLDVGKNVKLNGGFLSKGWVVVRNPLPIMVFIFLYIRELIGIGKTNEEIDRAINELFQDEEIDVEKLKEANIADILNHGGFFIIPVGSKISKDSANVPENAVVGKNCRIEDRLYCSRFEGGQDLIFTGFLKSKGDVWLAEGTKFTGDIQASGKVIVGKNVSIAGKISAKSVVIHETSKVEGKISGGNIRVAIGDDFDLKDHSSKEKILSKKDSFDKLNDVYIETKTAKSDDFEETEPDEPEKEKEPEEKIAEEKETSKRANQKKSAVKTAAEEPEFEPEPETKVESESKLETEHDAEAESESKPEEKEKQQSRRRKRRASKSKKSKEDIAIVNIFTGENMETDEAKDSDAAK